ncbi:hypothetical protein SH449x_001200 [Pirellulaceae bacterium SH449]
MMEISIMMAALVVLLVISFGLFAWKKARNLNIIGAAGGFVCFEHEWNSITNSSTQMPSPGHWVLKRMLGEYFFAVPKELVIGAGTATSNGKEWPKAMSELRTLTGVNIIDSPTVGDEVIPYLMRLPLVDTISLCGTNVGDERIEQICQLPKLRKLMIANTKVTEAKISELRRKFPSVEWV